jgi:hypothetical protein
MRIALQNVDEMRGGVKGAQSRAVHLCGQPAASGIDIQISRSLAERSEDRRNRENMRPALRREVTWNVSECNWDLLFFDLCLCAVTSMLLDAQCEHRESEHRLHSAQDKYSGAAFLSCMYSCYSSYRSEGLFPPLSLFSRSSLQPLRRILGLSKGASEQLL